MITWIMRLHILAGNVRLSFGGCQHSLPYSLSLSFSLSPLSHERHHSVMQEMDDFLCPVVLEMFVCVCILNLT